MCSRILQVAESEVESRVDSPVVYSLTNTRSRNGREINGSQDILPVIKPRLQHSSNALIATLPIRGWVMRTEES